MRAWHAGEYGGRALGQRDRPRRGRAVAGRLQQIVTAGAGLATLLIGMQMALKVENMLVVIASLVLGGVLGELLGIEAALERVGEGLQNELTATGGLLILAIGLLLLEVERLRVANLLPALLPAMPFTALRLSPGW